MISRDNFAILADHYAGIGCSRCRRRLFDLFTLVSGLLHAISYSLLRRFFTALIDMTAWRREASELFVMFPCVSPAKTKVKRLRDAPAEIYRRGPESSSRAIGHYLLRIYRLRDNARHFLRQHNAERRAWREAEPPRRDAAGLRDAELMRLHLRRLSPSSQP